MLDLIVGISLLLLIFIIKTAEQLYSASNRLDEFKVESIQSNSINLILIVFGIIAVAISVISHALKIVSLDKSFITAIVIIVIADIFYLVEKNPKITLKVKLSKIIWIVVIALGYITLVGSQLIMGNAYGEESWFTSTFIMLLDMDENGATLGFIGVGTLVLLSGMATLSKPMQYIGGFFLILVPLYSFINTLFNPLVYEYIQTTPLYDYFPSIIFASLIYLFLTLGVNVFIVIIPLIFISMMDKTPLN